MDMNVSLLKSAQVKSNVGKIDVSQFEDIKSANNTNIFSAQETIKTAENNVNMTELKAVESMMNDNCVRQFPTNNGKIRTLEINPNYKEKDPRTNTEKAEDDYEKAKKEYEEAKEKLEIYEAHDKYIEEEMAKYYEAHPDCKPTERQYINEEGKVVTELVESDAAKEYREGLEATYKAEHPEYVEQLNDDSREEIMIKLKESFKGDKIFIDKPKHGDIWGPMPQIKMNPDPLGTIGQPLPMGEPGPLAEAFSDFVDDIYGAVGDFVSDGVESTIDFIGDVGGAIGDLIEDGTEAIIDETKEIVEDIKDVLTNPEPLEWGVQRIDTDDEQARKKAEEFRRMTEM